ncbi:mitogen-activated protein kinase kinase kinase 3-like [Malania oleifera]|uniref:mitogen-activated protein kinase kinase kinase 3-like n=1 Tax=Malania oleifera TaxID=397392 RepID=UPI0025AEAFA1|nr:mitogen-activated protein kinase kinase kinase 3-like [Malania oleifera]
MVRLLPLLCWKMPSWWDEHTRNAALVSNERHFTSRASPPRSSNGDDKKEKKLEKPASFDDAVPLARDSPGTSHHDSHVFPAKSFDGSSDLLGFTSSPSNVGKGVIEEKRHYPLPVPAGSFQPRVAGSCSELVSCSNSSSSGSSSSSSSPSFSTSNDDVRGEFNYLRTHEDTKLSFWLTLCPGSRASINFTLAQYPLLQGKSLDSSSGKCINGSPCHPLPLPPGSPTIPSQCLESKWKKGRLLGRGTFGHVYSGFNSENGQMCAIKEVRVISDDHTSRECLKQLNQEIALLSQLSHPNIVQYYGSELGRDNLSVFLEYVSGGSILKLLREYGPFKEPVIQSYTRQILSGIAYLHGRNTVHRDIKGANILVDPNGEIKLVDFGLAKHMSSCASMLSFRGSPYWMAPEVISNTSGCSLAVDIWSLGCTVIEMATSKPPWSQYEGVAAIFKIANSHDFPEIPNHLSDNGKSFVKLCLQRDPSARPTAAQLLHHPFIQEQERKRVGKHNFLDDAHPPALDAGHSTLASCVCSTKMTTSLCDGDLGKKQSKVAYLRASKSSRV